MSYVQGFLLPVKNIKAYRKMARLASKVWIEHGALSYHEAAADDLKNPMGTAFDSLMKPKKGETLVFAFIVYKSRADVKRVMKKVMADKRLQGDMANMPFDMKRMAVGGFKTIVQNGRK